jgi:hypothetical protein
VAVRIVDRDTTYDELLPSTKELQAKIGAYDLWEPEFVVIVPLPFHDRFKKSRKVPGRPTSSGSSNLIDRVAERSIPPFFDRRKPLAQYRRIPDRVVSAMAECLSTAECVILLGAIVVVVGAGLLLVGPEIAAASTATEVTGTVVSLAARQLAKKAVAETLAKAAGVLIIFGTISSARGDELSFAEINAVRVIPLSQVASFRGTHAALSSGLCISDPPGTVPSKGSEVQVGDTVVFDSQPHYVVAKLRAAPGNAASECK